MSDVNSSPVPALINMFIWEKAFVKGFSDGTRDKYYFLRQDGKKIHTVYTHPHDHTKLVYYVKDCGDSQAASELFIAKQKERLKHDYVIMAGDISIPDAVKEPFSFFNA